MRTLYILAITILVIFILSCNKKNVAVVSKQPMTKLPNITDTFPDTDTYVGQFNDTANGISTSYSLQNAVIFFVIHLNDTTMVFINGNVPNNISINDTFKKNVANLYTTNSAILKKEFEQIGPNAFIINNDSLYFNWEYATSILDPQYVVTNNCGFAGKLN